ncbi:hypothetical protein [Qipengyuania sediminis]|uniref:hypothetical protein n=1 Tax=Qipengyuania sediminis TaxID=1532023 RepID=UPI0010599265|nr:hypothetical protein [Qipengyuania sediminis]
MALAALALPVAAGLCYLWLAGAPPSYLAVNGGALVLATLWIAVAPVPTTIRLRRTLIALILGLLFLPILTGPDVNGVTRWLPLGPFQLHAGMVVVPLLAVLLGEERELAPGLLSIALLAALLQPDMATGAALMLAAVGLYDATKDWRFGLFAVVAFTVSLVAAMHGELPAQPFVERVIATLARSEPVGALALLAGLLASFYLVIAALPGPIASRKALAGCLFGFVFAGTVSNYPSPLIGYGAAPILGFGLALGVLAAMRAPQLR